MSGEFDAWLRGLKTAKKGPVTALAASRGRAWTWPISLTGDWSGATLRGEVRASPDAGGAAMAEFTVTGPVVSGGFSTFTLSLSDTETASDLSTDGDGDGVTHLLYDLLLTPSGGDEELLFGGVFPVLGRITA